MDKLDTRATSFHPGTGPTPPMALGHSYATITDKIAAVPIHGGWPRFWIIGFVIAFSIVQLLALSTAGLLAKGTGLWGINIPVGWGFAIINFVWWIGIGHAGTLISAILLLLKQQWRMSISRFAESMTIFAVMCAAVFPVLHTGRPWLAAYWLLPYPNTMSIWPQPRSPLEWDVFAVSTYATVSIIFWYIGLIPDFATMRDQARTAIGQKLYGVFSLGWRGSAKHWIHYEIASTILAGISTPLVLSVHTVVSFDFATGLIPGWHTTVFPPYFVAGAIYSGFAMVVTLAVPMRAKYNMKDFITDWHLENMAKVMLATGLIVAYGYGLEAFMAWYSGNTYEMFMFKNRAFGPMGWSYWALILFNILIPQLLWLKSFRTSAGWLVFISICINIGMWLERFVIVVTSLYRDFIPSSWGTYAPTIWDWGLYIGTMGFFMMMMLLFVRGLPTMPMFELRVIMPKKEGSHHG